MYVFREHCFQLIMYFVSAEGTVERIINVHYYYLLSHLSADIDTHACKLAHVSASVLTHVSVNACMCAYI